MKALFGCFVNDEIIIGVFKFNDFVLHYKVINCKDKSNEWLYR